MFSSAEAKTFPDLAEAPGTMAGRPQSRLRAEAGLGDNGIPDFVVLSDDFARRSELAATFRTVGVVRCLDAVTAEFQPVRPFNLVIDVDLKSGGSIAGLRRFLAAHRAFIEHSQAVVADGDHWDETQALALGVTEVLPRSSSRRSILRAMRRRMSAAFRERLSLSEATPTTVGLQAAHGVLETIFEGVPSGLLPKGADIDRASNLIIEAIREEGVSTWLATVRAHHSSSYRHSLIVTGAITQFGQRLGMSRGDQARLARVALVHDVGKALIPLDVLDNPGELSLRDVMLIEAHPEHGFELLSANGAFSSETLEGVLRHHEMLDGSGYPDGFSGGQIADIVRILTICDIYSALIEERAYKPAYDREQALAIMGRMTGKLDPDLFRAFARYTAP